MVLFCIVEKNPFYFNHFNLDTIILRKNGETLPFQEIEMDFDDKLYLQGYMSLLEGTSHLFKDCTLDINPFADFNSG